ncbi:spore germination YkwD domain-containing protein [Abiotrophia defectiva]|uniref:hypothetical protein n=1 Tax=Abiotrophia defectiva TaxID=46125 RepID=UPI0002F2DC36|nr:hypothetical protein [Abiotrophia defectiva]QKH46170.1 hypothetical protein FOC79_00495 [Abiotrophia defectiva]
MKKKLLFGLAAAALLTATATNSDVSAARSRNNYNSYNSSRSYNTRYNTRNNYWNYGYNNYSNSRNNYWNYGYNNYNNGYNNYYYGYNYGNGYNNYYYDYGYNYGYNYNYNNTTRRITYSNGRYWYTDRNNVKYYYSNGQWVRYVEESTSNDYFYYNGRYYKLTGDNKYLVWENNQWVPLEEEDNSSSESSSESSSVSSEASSESSSESSSVVSEVSSESSSESSSVASEVSSESSSESSSVSSEASSSSSAENIFPGLEESSSVESHSDFDFDHLNSSSSSESSSSSQLSYPDPTSTSESTDISSVWSGSEYPIPAEGYARVRTAVYPPGTPNNPKVYNDSRYRYNNGKHYFVEKDAKGKDIYWWTWEKGRWFLHGEAYWPGDPGFESGVHENPNNSDEYGYTYDETVSPKLYSDIIVGKGKAGDPLPFSNTEEFKKYVLSKVNHVFKDNYGYDLKVTYSVEDEDKLKGNAAGAWGGRYILEAKITSTGKEEYEWGYVNYVYEVEGIAQDENSEYGYEDMAKAKEAFALINQARTSKGLPALTWDDASYSAGQEALKGLLKNWDSSGMVARATASPSDVVNKFLGNAHAQTLLSSRAVSGSVSLLQKADSTYYWKITINESADGGAANDGFQPLPAQDDEYDAAASHEALIEELNSRPLEWNN